MAFICTFTVDSVSTNLHAITLFDAPSMSARKISISRRDRPLTTSPAWLSRLHPRLAEIYAEKVQQLEKALNDPDIRDEAAYVLRALIDRIELHPGRDGQGVDARLFGDLVQILSLCEEADHTGKLPEAGTSGSQLSVVAGACNRHYLLFRAEGLSVITPTPIPPIEAVSS